MSENARPRGGGGAADDVLTALSTRVRELQSKLAAAQSELDEARHRVATYEEFDATLQDALASALRAAHEIRTRAEQTAGQILDQAREERRVLMKEGQRLREERDQLQDEIASLRRGGIAPVPRPAPHVEAPSAAELKAAASEAMRSIFDEIVQEMRGRTATAHQAAAAVSPPPPPAATAAPPQPAPPPASARQAQVVERPAAPAQTAPAAPRPQPAAPRPVPPPPAAYQPSSPLPQQTPVAPAKLGEAPPVPSAPERQPERAAAEAPSSTMEIQLVLSPVPSFPRLVEIERRIQSLPSVRTLYVRDFRNGVATLAVGLRSAMTGEEFGAAVQTLDRPRFHVESVARNSLELRVDGEAATA